MTTPTQPVPDFLDNAACDPEVTWTTGNVAEAFPGETELDEGDILFCETTDPGWVSLFLVAGGVVTDFGGLLSHGPIVARELGIPCVCGTEDGSTRICDGQRIRVDGDRGTVEVLH
jgi:pyruvate,water dikinase